MFSFSDKSYYIIHVYSMYIYIYMIRRKYLVHHAIDRVFLPRSPFRYCLLGPDLVLQRGTCFDS